MTEHDTGVSNPFYKKSCLVTGAAGFIGGHMVRILAERGAIVVAADIAHAPLEFAEIPNCIYVDCDVSKEEDANHLFFWGNYDFVFHMACQHDPRTPDEQLYQVNVQGTLNLLSAIEHCGDAPKRFVHLADGGVYDFARGKRGVPAKESDPTPKALSPYLRTKQVAEAELLSKAAKVGIPVASLRPGHVYGPDCTRGITGAIITAAGSGFYPFYAGPMTTRVGTVHVEDVCRAAMFVACHTRTDGQIYNVCDDSSFTTVELLRKCSAYLGYPFLPGIVLPIRALRWLCEHNAKKATIKGTAPILTNEMVELREVDAVLDARKLKALGWAPRHPDALSGLLEVLKPYRPEQLS